MVGEGQAHRIRALPDRFGRGRLRACGGGALRSPGQWCFSRWPRPAGHSPSKAPTAAAVKPRAFGSCVALVELCEGEPRAHAWAPGAGDLRAGRDDLDRGTEGHCDLDCNAGSARAPPPTPARPRRPPYSTTNDQEQGVDEPDIVKTDGSTIFAVSGNTLEAVSVAGGVAAHRGHARPRAGRLELAAPPRRQPAARDLEPDPARRPAPGPDRRRLGLGPRLAVPGVGLDHAALRGGRLRPDVR